MPTKMIGSDRGKLHFHWLGIVDLSLQEIPLRQAKTI
jgi:hypothetical protein